MFKQLFRKWPEVISENGFLSTWSRKPYKIVQIKSFRFKNTPETAQAIRLCAYLKSHCVSEGFNFAEAVCHSVTTLVKLGGIPRPESGAAQSWWSKRMLNFYCVCLKMQRVMKNLRR